MNGVRGGMLDLFTGRSETWQEVWSEIRRVLKPSGIVFWGTKNRYDWRTWFRQVERKGAGLKVPGGQRGLQKLLHNIGYTHTTFFVPMPGYLHPGAMIPAENKKDIARLTRRNVKGLHKKAIQHLKGMLTAQFPEAFSIVASAEPVVSYLDRLAGHIAEVHDLPVPSRFHYRMNGEMGMVTILYQSGASGIPFVLKLPIHARGLGDLIEEVSLIKQVHAGNHSLSSMAPLFPAILGSGVLDGQYYALLSLLPGISGEKIEHRFPRRLKALESGLELAAKFYEAGKKTRPEESLQSRLQTLHSLVRSLAWNGRQERAVDRAVALVKDRFAHTENVLQTYGHGDFKFANLLFDPHSLAITGVIDWGANTPQELFGYDVQFLAVDFQRQMSGRSLSDLLQGWIHNEKRSPELDRLLEKYISRTERPWLSGCWDGIAAYQWLKRLVPLAGPFETQRFNHRYLDEMFAVFDD